MQVTFYDLDNNPVFDPEQIIQAEGLRFASRWPGGYSTCNFNVTRRDIFATWPVRNSHGIIIRDGQRIVWQGRIDGTPQQRNGTSEFVSIRAVGWFVVLKERRIHKWWVDDKPLDRLEWPAGAVELEATSTFVPIKRENWLEVQFGAGDVLYSNSVDYYAELYKAPVLNYIRRIVWDEGGRSGEGIFFVIGNYDNGGVPGPFESSTPDYHPGWTDAEFHDLIGRSSFATGSGDVTLTLGNTTTLSLNFQPEADDLYDQNDRCYLTNMIVYFHYHADHSDYASPSYTTGELVQDVLLIANDAGATLSQNYNWIDEPGYTVSPFTVENPTSASDVVADLAAYGDSSLNTYGLAVWDKTGTTDGLPRVEFTKRDTSDYEYRVTLDDAQLAAFSVELDGVQLYNWIIVEYTDSKNKTRWMTPDDDSDLKDADSIAADYRREYVVKIGQADATRAKYAGVRFLERHSTRLRKGSFSVQGAITTKAGLQQPVSWCKAGERVLVEPLGETFFIRQFSYDDASETATFTPDLPPDALAVWQKQG